MSLDSNQKLNFPNLLNQGVCRGVNKGREELSGKGKREIKRVKELGIRKGYGG